MPDKANVSIVLARDERFDVFDFGLTAPGHLGNLADHAAQGRLDLLALAHIPPDAIAKHFGQLGRNGGAGEGRFADALVADQHRDLVELATGLIGALDAAEKQVAARPRGEVVGRSAEQPGQQSGQPVGLIPRRQPLKPFLERVNLPMKRERVQRVGERVPAPIERPRPFLGVDEILPGDALADVGERSIRDRRPSVGVDQPGRRAIPCGDCGCCIARPAPYRPRRGKGFPSPCARTADPSSRPGSGRAGSACRIPARRLRWGGPQLAAVDCIFSPAGCRRRVFFSVGRGWTTGEIPQ